VDVESVLIDLCRQGQEIQVELNGAGYAALWSLDVPEYEVSPPLWTGKVAEESGLMDGFRRAGWI
jgi:hypothetical protein